MARRHKHEEHANHEAWAIPYGDLITLLLAFFVVMYAMSSVNEGKYRVLSDSLVAAFQGAPKTIEPIQVGEKQAGPGTDPMITMVQPPLVDSQPRAAIQPIAMAQHAPTPAINAAQSDELASVAAEVEQAMSDLIDRELIVVRRHGTWVEVEIRTDILFPSGIATLSPPAEQVLTQLAQTLKPFPNSIRVEGHTDNRPINRGAFPSNWELSSARAASVVHLFTRAGMDPARLAVVGLGENRPVQSNATPEGRNANRRVVLVILGGTGKPEGDYAGERGQAEPEQAVPTALPQPSTTEASLQTPPTAHDAAHLPK
ncbi:MAG TPA: flagellar motor protein MotD [Steroidobacteraceae bacterium]|jgi:chemotaxis protein MotB|nr:flagellar motor protein MotD [Steroidobacteraceae bacterium]